MTRPFRFGVVAPLTTDVPMGIGTGRPGIEDELRRRGLPVVPPSERLAQVGACTRLW
jgi:hypothetical protein